MFGFGPQSDLYMALAIAFGFHLLAGEFIQNGGVLGDHAHLAGTIQGFDLFDHRSALCQLIVLFVRIRSTLLAGGHPRP